MQPTTTVTTPPNKSFDQQLADIKSQARSIVTQAQKIDPNIKIKPIDAQMIGLKVDIPNKKQTPPRPTELDKVGTTPVPKTSLEIAREALLGSVKEEDRDTIAQILDVSTGLQTERGSQLEGTMDSILTQQLANIQSTRDRARESTKMQEAQRIPELQAELESIRGENDVLQARRNAAIQAAEREQGLSTAAKSGNVARISRDFDLEQANLAIRELASVGKINAATKLIDTKLDLKYGDLEAESNLLTAQLTAIKPFLDREDQKAADMRLQLNEVVKAKLADARESDKMLEDFKLQSYIFAQQNGASPAVLSQIMSSTSREDVASVGGSFIQDPMQKLEMRATEASIANTYNQITDRNTRLQLAIEAATLEDMEAAQAGLKEEEAKSEKALGMFSLLNEMENHPGLNDAVGPNLLARGISPFGIGSTLITGSRSEFRSLADQVANTLTLQNMSALKGPATDKDVELVANSVSRLKNFDVSEPSYRKEIQKIKDAMQRIVVNSGATEEQLRFYGLADDTTLSQFDSYWNNSASTPLLNSAY